MRRTCNRDGGKNFESNFFRPLFILDYCLRTKYEWKKTEAWYFLQASYMAMILLIFTILLNGYFYFIKKSLFI